MDVLDRLTEEQRTLVVSLPYRVGLWVSHADQSGGADAEEKERTALHNILDGFAHQVFGSELLQYIMNGTVTRKGEWPAWGEDLEAVPVECERALDVLRVYVDEKDINAYVTRLMEIAEAVALAFREYERLSMKDQLVIYSSYLFMKVKARFQKNAVTSYDQYLSISVRERKALGQLSHALGAQYTV